MKVLKLILVPLAIILLTGNVAESRPLRGAAIQGLGLIGAQYNSAYKRGIEVDTSFNSFVRIGYVRDVGEEEIVMIVRSGEATDAEIEIAGALVEDELVRISALKFEVLAKEDDYCHGDLTKISPCDNPYDPTFVKFQNQKNTLSEWSMELRVLKGLMPTKIIIEPPPLEEMLQ